MSSSDGDLPDWLTTEYYQRWLRDGLVGTAFPWHEAVQTTFPAFLGRYTLHDSVLIGLWTGAATKPVLVIRWDLAWNERIDIPLTEIEVRDRDLGAADAVPFWPVLLLQFSALYQITLRGVGDTESRPIIFDALSGPAGPEQLAALQWAQETIRETRGEARQLGGLTRDRDAVPDAVHETTIKTTTRDGLRLLHDSHVAILLMDRDGVVYPLPDL